MVNAVGHISLGLPLLTLLIESGSVEPVELGNSR